MLVSFFHFEKVVLRTSQEMDTSDLFSLALVGKCQQPGPDILVPLTDLVYDGNVVVPWMVEARSG